MPHSLKNPIPPHVQSVFFLLFNYFLSPSLQILPTLNRINPNDHRSVNSPIYWTVELCFLQKCSPQREGTGWMVLVLPRVISSCSRVSASLLCCILGRLELTSVCTGLAHCYAACTHTHTINLERGTNPQSSKTKTKGTPFPIITIMSILHITGSTHFH